MKTEELYHYATPLIYQSKKSFADFTLYLNINPYSIIEGLFFTGPPDSPWLRPFSQLCRLCEGKRLSNDFISQIDLPSPVKQWNLPLWLLRATYREALQINYPHDKLTGHNAEDLICRCFGVYLPQIRQFSSLKEVTDETRAGGGCSRCHGQIEKIIAPLDPVPLLSKKDFNKMKALANLFIKQNFPSNTLTLTGIYGNRIKVTLSGNEHNKEKIFQSVEKLIEYNFHVKVFLDYSS